MPQIINNWPYSDMHNLNLDWILTRIKELGHKVENVEAFFPHISTWNNGNWDIDHDYELNEIVINGNDIYLAKKNVPAGENINNTDYWLLVGTDSYITNKVDKAGDTMTGTLQTPHVSIYNATYPALNFETAANGSSIADVIADVNNRLLMFRTKGSNGTHEYFKLPAHTETADTDYKVVTTKDGVLAYIEHTETITVSANTWTQVAITQFTAPAGYTQIAMNLGTSTDSDARNFLYVMCNAMSNMNKLLVYSTVALTNVDITLDAWFIRDEDLKNLT